MHDYSVKRILADRGEIRLPHCVFGGSRCSECIYFMRHEKVDMEGRSRCSYKCRWMYPYEGCGNGIDYITHRKMLAEEEKKRREQEERERREQEERERREQEERERREREQRQSYGSGGYTVQHTGGRGGSVGQNTGAAGAGILFLVVAGAAILFALGILQPTVAFRMPAVQTPSAQYTAYTLNAVRMDDGSNYYPKNFRDYCAKKESFNDYGNSFIDLKKGEYDAWISHDGISGFAGDVKVDRIFDKDVSVSTENVEKGKLRTVILRLRGKGGKAVVADDLRITDGNGAAVKCTSYREEGCYIAVLPDAQLTATAVTLKIQAAGFADCELELDFGNQRTLQKKVKLST